MSKPNGLKKTKDKKGKKVKKEKNTENTKDNNNKNNAKNSKKKSKKHLNNKTNNKKTKTNNLNNKTKTNNLNNKTKTNNLNKKYELVKKEDESDKVFQIKHSFVQLLKPTNENDFMKYKMYANILENVLFLKCSYEKNIQDNLDNYLKQIKFNDFYVKNFS